MKQSKKVSKHWINSYLLSLIVLAGLLLCAGGIIYTSCIFDKKIISDVSERIAKLLVYMIPCIVFLAFCIIKSYDIFGRVAIYEDRLILSAPFHKQLTYMVDEIRYVQIDYNLLSTDKQFWVVIGSDMIPHKYVHKINELPITPNRLKIQFTPALDERLDKLFAGRLSKEYSRAKSTLRAHGVS